MTRKLLVVVPFLFAAAPPARGDVAALVEVRPAGTVGRVTFAGVGVGSSRDAAVAAFGDNLGIPGDGAYLGTVARGEPGTRLEVLWNVRGGRVDYLSLTYTGSPAALRRVAAQWRAILRAAGADCDERWCYWDEGEMTIAKLHADGSGHHGPEVSVTLSR